MSKIRGGKYTKLVVWLGCDSPFLLPFRLVPKITHRHIYLTGSDRMKVKLATQLLSQTVRLALTREGTGSTSLLCW